jgi:hypothetical protein
VVAPARVWGGVRDRDADPATCDESRQSGTSWASPSAAGAAALVRQYYVDGFYPSGKANAAHAMSPSAALLKATIIAAARAVPWRRDLLLNQTVEALPVPSHEQGWGFPVLDDALHFEGDARRLRVVDVPLASGLEAGAEATIAVDVKSNAPLKVVLVWTDPPGTVRGATDTTPQLVNDLDLVVAGPDGTRRGNGATADRLNNVEVVSIAQPSPGRYAIKVVAHRLGLGPRQGYALVVSGEVEAAPSRTRAVRH